MIWRHLDGDDGGGSSSSSGGGGDCAADVVHLLFSYCFSSFLTISVCSNSFLFPPPRTLSLSLCQMYRYEFLSSHTRSHHTLTDSLTQSFSSVLCFSSLLYRFDFFAFVSASLLFCCFFFSDFSSLFSRCDTNFALVGTVGDFVLFNLNETHSVCSLPVWNRAERTHMAIAHKKLCECLVAC